MLKKKQIMWGKQQILLYPCAVTIFFRNPIRIFFLKNLISVIFLTNFSSAKSIDFMLSDNQDI